MIVALLALGESTGDPLNPAHFFDRASVFVDASVCWPDSSRRLGRSVLLGRRCLAWFGKRCRLPLVIHLEFFIRTLVLHVG